MFHMVLYNIYVLSITLHHAFQYFGAQHKASKPSGKNKRNMLCKRIFQDSHARQNTFKPSEETTKHIVFWLVLKHVHAQYDP